jgi:hypothetical protein
VKNASKFSKAEYGWGARFVNFDSLMFGSL